MPELAVLSNAPKSVTGGPVLGGSRFFIGISRMAGDSRIARMLGARLNRSGSFVTARYCRRFGLSKDEISAGAAFVFLATYVVSSLLLFLIVGCLSILLSLLVAYGVSAWFYNWIPRKLAKEKMVISREVPLISQEIILASASSGSIFNLITLIAGGRHPIVSKVFSRILERTNNGDKPETLVINYANHQPCETLRRTLLDAISLGLDWNEMKGVLQRRRGEAEFEYQKYTMQVESRILLLVGLGTFWPIIFTIAVSVNGLWRNLVSVTLVALLFFVVLFLLEGQLMKPVRNIQILGGHSNARRKRGLFNRTSTEELQEMIVIISLLGELLHRENISPESALGRVSETYDGWLSPLLKETAIRIVYNGETFNDAWIWFKSRFSNAQCRQILGTLQNMIDSTAEVAGERLMDVASYVKDNQILIEERENTVGAQRFKAKLLSLISSASLGLMATLSPLFMMVGTWQSNPAIFQPTVWTSDILGTVAILLLMTIVNTYNAMRAVGTERPATYVCLSASVFLTVFVLSTRLLSGLI